MTKKFKRIFNIILALGMVITISFAARVSAAGTATLKVSGPTTASLNETITVTIVVDNISANNGVVGVGGVLKFDTTYLEPISVTGATSPYVFSAVKQREGEYSLAGLDFTGANGIKTNTAIYTLSLKAIKTGTTKIEVREGELSDAAGDILSLTNTPLNITIGESSGGSDPEDPPVEQPKSSNADLNTLSVSGYTISPAFDKDTLNYTLTVPNNQTEVTINATLADGKASIAGTGRRTLDVGANPLKVTVKAEDGTTKIYTINVTRSEDTSTPETDTRSGDATLKSLSVSNQNISPAFDKSKTSYTLTVPNDTTSIDVSAIANDSKATVTISGNTNLKVGVNPVKITVKAENGTTNVYTINVTRKASSASGTTTTPTKSSNNYLKSLETTNGDIKPNFDKTKNNYSITVPYNISRLTDITAIPEDEKATAKINGNANFKVGEVNTVEIIVTAEDGSERTYTLNVTRASSSGDVLLDDIDITGGGVSGLNPKFDPEKFTYTVEIPHGTDSINVIPKTSNPDAKVEVTGTDNLQEGNNVVLIKVTDKDGFVQYYKINAYKKVASGLLLFGIDFPKWVIYTLIALVPFLLILLAFARRKKQEQIPNTTIEFKPEFNFSSKNGTDDDYVESGGVLNQASRVPEKDNMDIRDIPSSRVGITDGTETATNSKLIGTARVIDQEVHELPYDPYDDEVTKDEIIDAINEKNPEKLKILYQQEMLNREKERIKAEENREQRSRYHDDNR